MKSIPLRQWEAAAYAASGETFQLRRVCRPQPVDAPSFVHYGTKSIVKEVASGQIFTTEQCIAALVQFAPYGSPGDKLALREAWGIPDGAYPGTAAEYVSYRSDESTWHCHTNDAPLHRKSQCSGYISPAVWNSPVTMPLWAVRWHPVITAVRLERVQDMSEADAFLCGIERIEIGPFEIHGVPVHPMTDTYVNSYRKQFDSDNPRTPWDSNPWTWVIDVEGNTK